MTRILLITERYTACEPRHGASSWARTFESTLTESGYGVLRVNVEDGLDLLELAAGFKPDFIVSNVYSPISMIPSLKHLSRLAPSVAMMTDTVQPTQHIDHLYPDATLVVISDTIDPKPMTVPHIVLPWIRENDYRVGSERRDIDVSFVGNEGHPWRQQALAELVNDGIDVVTRNGERLSQEQYIQILQRSKIVLNFPFAIVNGEPLAQFKARGIEVMQCGAMLLEANIPHTRKWFEPGVDYATVGPDQTYAGQIRQYLDGWEQIAARGTETVHLYRPDIFWLRVFGQAVIIWRKQCWKS